MERSKLLSQLKDIESWANGLQAATNRLITRLEKEENAAGKKNSSVNDAMVRQIAAARRQRLLKKT